MYKKSFKILISALFWTAINMAYAGEETLTMWRTVYAMPQGVESESICDLSNVVIEDCFDMKIEQYGDTLMSRTIGTTREWFYIKSDTVWSLGSNSRTEMQRYKKGIPYLITDGITTLAATDSIRFASLYSYDAATPSSSLYAANPGCGFIFNSGDTISATSCVTTITSDSLWTVKNSRWYAQHSSARNLYHRNTDYSE